MKMSENLKTNIKTRPPLVIFAVCLMGVIITTFSLAYYVKGHYEILGSDEKNDWISLLKYLSRRLDRMCLTAELPTASVLSTTDYDKRWNPSDTINVSTIASLSIPPQRSRKLVEGSVNLRDWTGGARCHEKTLARDNVTVVFELPVNLLRESVVLNVCVTLLLPTGIFKHILAPNSCEKLSSEVIEKKVERPLERMQFQFSSCSDTDDTKNADDTTAISLQFEADNLSVEFEEYLTQEDRLRINYNLIITSCFLIAVVVMITCFAMFNRRNGDGRIVYIKGNYI